MNLREVRAAANGFFTYGSTDDLSESAYSAAEYIVKYILATIDPEPDAPITADWLREVWGFENIPGEDDDEYYLDHNYMHYSILLTESVGTFYFDCEDGDAWPHDIHCRQQFADLARCLGLKRKDGK